MFKRRWEYLTLIFVDDTIFATVPDGTGVNFGQYSRRKLGKVMNEIGTSGWELVSLEIGSVAVFKRRKSIFSTSVHFQAPAVHTI